MEFHVAQLLREPVGSQRSFSVDERCDAGESSPVRGDVVLLRTDAGLLATATLHTTVQATCSRCLVPAHVPVQLQIEEEFYPTVDIVSGSALPLPDDPGAFMIDEHHILDLCEAVRQQLIVAEPMQPLCRDDCAGLCPGAAPIQPGIVRCSPGDLDARWASLRDFMNTTVTASENRERHATTPKEEIPQGAPR